MSKHRSPKLYIGAMGWSYPFWVGSFYPKGLTKERLLTEYSKHFNIVEIINSFYRIPSAKTVRTWKRQTSEDFLFSKFPRIITHATRPQNCEKETELFIYNISQLENRLGPLHLQLPSSFWIQRSSSS